MNMPACKFPSVAHLNISSREQWKSIGDSMQPCLTPILKSNQLLCSHPMNTEALALSQRICISLVTSPPSLTSHGIAQRGLYLILSNTLEKSTKIWTTFSHSTGRLNICSTVTLLDLTLACSSARKFPILGTFFPRVCQ